MGRNNIQLDEIFILNHVLSKNFQISHEQKLANEYGKRENLELLQQLLTGLATRTSIVDISLENMQQVISKLSSEPNSVIFNLCDGTEKDGYPGISVVKLLEENRLKFTGADSYFYQITTSKPDMKKLFMEKNVPTSRYGEIHQGTEDQDIDEITKYLDFPMIIKPSVSYASLNITYKSVVHSRLEAIQHAKSLSDAEGGLFAECFLEGREFTVLCVHVYPPAERLFRADIPPKQRFLAFDKYWDGYTIDSPDPQTAEEIPLYQYVKCPLDWEKQLKDVAKRAYLSCGGTGYGRVDIRTASFDECDPFVLEVNANCGMSFSENSSSTAEILRLSNINPREFCKELIQYAIDRVTK